MSYELRSTNTCCEPPRFIDIANIPIFGVDVHGDINEWNKKTVDITGFSKADVLGKSLVDTFIVSNQYTLAARLFLDNALRGIEDDNGSSNHELEFRTKNPKQIRYLLSSATTIRGVDNKNVVGVIIVAQDTTKETTERKRKLTEEKALLLMDSDELKMKNCDDDRAMVDTGTELHRLIDTANAPIFGINESGNITEWNRKIADITGFSKGEVLNKSLVSFYVMPSFRPSVQKAMDNALKGHETRSYSIALKIKNDKINKVRYFLVNATSRRDADNKIVGVVGVAQDITESRRNDRVVAALTHELTSLVDTANAPIFGIDVNGNVNEWNNKTADITGFSKEEAIGKPLVSKFIVPSLRKVVQEVMDKALDGNETSNYELEFETKSKEIRYLLVNAKARRDNESNIVGVIGVAQDVTTSKGVMTESKQLAQAESTIANDLRQLFDTANAPIFGINTNGIVNEWNNKTAEITEFSKDEVWNKPLVSTFIMPSLRESVQKVMDDALKGHETSNYSLEFRTKSNKIRYLLVNATSRRDANNNIVGVVGVAQDVTESRINDRAVAALAHELRLLVDTANAPIFGIDVNGSVNEWNDKTAEITGFSKEEAIGKPLVSTFIVPLLKESVQEVMDMALQGNETSNYELEFETKWKEIRYLLVNATTRRDADSNIIGVVGVAQDVTEAFQHDRAVAAMARELRHLVDSANAPIFGIDVDGNVNEWNDKTAEITGFNGEEAFYQPLVSTFIVPKLRQSVQEVLNDALMGIGTSNYELEFRTKNNEIRYLLVNATTRRDADNNIVGVVGVAQDVTETAKHDRAVAAMANELRQLIDTANAPIFGIDMYGMVNEWNFKTAEITGFSKLETYGKPLVQNFIVPKLQNAVQEILDNALRGYETSNYSLEFRTKSNETRYLLVNATTRRDAENNVVGVVGVAQDVSEAAKHDRAVTAMARELRQLVDKANAPIFGIDVDGNVNEWNDKTAEITGFSKEEALGKPLVLTYIVPKLRKTVQGILDDALKGNETSNYELEFRTKTNEIRYFLVNATTRLDAENNVVGVVGVAQDVTEAATHDRAVAAMANELRQLVDTANAPIFGIDVHGNVNEWNNKTAEITGFSKEEAHGNPLVSTFIVPELRQSVQEVMDNAIEGKETSNYELEFETKTKEIRYLLVNATTRRDAENNIVGVVGVAQDVTDDRRHSEELRQMQYIRASQEGKVETERNMTAYFAHELRNPLHAIDSALNSMPDNLPESAQSLVAAMQLCTSFMSSIMNNLLDVRKMEEGQLKLNTSVINLEDILTSLHQMLSASVRPGVEFKAKKICKDNWVLGDSHRIQQVLTNVITNAIKYTTKGSIQLVFSLEDGIVCFKCIDTGPGIPKKEQTKLFQRFVQRGGAPGTGLGLAIAKHIVDLTGGSIYFDSDPTLKSGTTCIVKMPLKVCAPPEAIARDISVAVIEIPITILIIDDVNMNRTMLKRRIMKGVAPNALITEACTGEEALTICGAEEFDIIIVDQYMEEAGGVMVGTDVVFAMRRLLINSIIIGCSGNDMDDLFREAGSDWVWGKPTPPNKVIVKQLRKALMENGTLKQ